MLRSRRHVISVFALTGFFSVLGLFYMGICQAGPTKPPAAPSNLAAKAVSYSQINLTWKDNSWNEAGFSIERMASGGAFSQIATVGAKVASFQDTTVSASTTYSYRVRAFNSAGYSAYSNTATVTTPIPPPAAPTNLTASAISTSQINLSWTNNATNVTGFYVQRSTDDVNFSQVGSTGSARTSYSDGALNAGTTYYYRVYAYNSSGNSAYSNVANATTVPNPPAAPSSLTATAASSSQINLSWTNNATNQSGFYIQRSTDNVNFSQVGSSTATSFSDSGLNASTTYYYRVDAYNAGGTSANSNTANATTSSATSQTPISLPIEVLGPAGTTQTVSFTLPTGTASQVASFLLQINNLSYPDKASIQINNGSWVALDNNSVQVADPGKSYGGIGGGFNTLQMSLPLSSGAVSDGTNTISFRFNRTEGLSMGFRVLAFNLLDANGNSLLPTSTFTQDDPNTWQPPLNDSTDIQAGQTLWHTATLTFSPINSATMQAHCADCHSDDGRDLKYFNYSNNSILQRALFHGLSQQQGQQIASYIRSLSVPNPGRPWNPPYQPGPGIDSQPAANWAAGAGLPWALANDTDTLAYLFPNGSYTASAISLSNPINIRNIPIVWQFPDWNHWLPRVHPKDAITQSSVALSLGLGTIGQDWPASTANTTYLAIKQNLATGGSYVSSGQAAVDLESLSGQLMSFIRNHEEAQGSSNWQTDPGNLPNEVYSLALWGMSKSWEIMQESGMEGLGPTLYPATSLYPAGEPLMWPTQQAFLTSPFMLEIPETSTTAIGPSVNPGTTVSEEYLSSVWYQLQFVLGIGNHRPDGNDPIDFPYTWGKNNDLRIASGFEDGGRFLATYVAAMQQTNNGYGVAQGYMGWNPLHVLEPYLLGWEFVTNPNYRNANNPDWKFFDKIPPATYAAIVTAILSNWYAKSVGYAVADYVTYGVNPSYVINTSSPNPEGSDMWADQMWVAIPAWRGLGVDGTLLNNLCDFMASLYPNNNWASLKQ